MKRFAGLVLPDGGLRGAFTDHGRSACSVACDELGRYRPPRGLEADGIGALANLLRYFGR